MTGFLLLLSEGFTDPSSLGGLQVWYDAGKTSTLTLSGADVTDWASRAAGGIDASQGTTSLQPDYDATGLDTTYPTVTFDGTDDHMDYTLQALTEFTVFAVGNGSGHIASDNTAAASSRLYNGNCTFSDGTDKGVWNDLSATAGEIITFTYDGTTVKGRNNGAQTGTGAASSKTLNLDNLADVRGSGSSVSHWNGNISEFIIYNRALVEGDIKSVEMYLALKWGITLRTVLFADDFDGTHNTTLASRGWSGGIVNKVYFTTAALSDSDMLLDAPMDDLVYNS